MADGPSAAGARPGAPERPYRRDECPPPRPESLTRRLTANRAPLNMPRPTGAAPPRARSPRCARQTPATSSAPSQPLPAPAPVEATPPPSDHPEAIKARRWRGRRRLQRQGDVIVEFAVSPAQSAGCMPWGVAGTPSPRATPASAEAVALAVGRTLDAAEPLARVATASTPAPRREAPDGPLLREPTPSEAQLPLHRRGDGPDRRITRGDVRCLGR